MGKYKRKTERQSWSEESMREAVTAVLDGTMGYLKASKEYGVPRTTIEAHVKKVRKGVLTRENSAKKGLGRHKPVFTEAQEQELEDHILALEARLFGFTLEDLRSLAFHLAERNGLANQFNKEKKKAGKAWLYGFLKRHRKVALRLPEPTSLARAMGFNRPAVAKFFSLLAEIYKTYKIPPERIYNVDETGIMTVPKRRSRCLALRGKKQVGSLSSAERGVLVTAETCMGAAGAFMPTMFVFPRARAKPELLDDTPPGSTAAYHPSGWMQTDIFLEWFNHFLQFSRPTKEEPVLLLLDGHSTHTKSLELIKRARENNVILLCFPPHTTHRLQPLDVTFMGPLSTFYAAEVQKWLQQHPGRIVTIIQIGKLYGDAFMKAASVQTAVNGFKKTGIWPLNPDVFPDWMFEPAETTNRPIENQTPTQETIVQPAAYPLTPDRHETLPEEVTPQSSRPDIHKTPPRSMIPRKSADFNNEDSVKSINDMYEGVTSSYSSISSAAFYSISPKYLAPLPQAERKPSNPNDKRKGKTAILTSTPYKKELEEAIKKKNKKVKTLNMGDVKGKSKVNKQATKSNPKQKNKSNSKRSNKSYPKTREIEDSTSEEEQGSSTALCIYCSDLYSNSKPEDGWIKCQGPCNEWAHEACAGIEPDDCESPFICDLCR